jgi:hypothetical protein
LRFVEPTDRSPRSAPKRSNATGILIATPTIAPLRQKKSPDRDAKSFSRPSSDFAFRVSSASPTFDERAASVATRRQNALSASFTPFD